ncbi:unnamed protein product, partial [marine sediment metagenome]
MAEKEQVRKILLVDDDPLILETLSGIFNKKGYEAISTSDGVKALKKLESERPDLILLDVNMPEMDGIETC